MRYEIDGAVASATTDDQSLRVTIQGETLMVEESGDYVTFTRAQLTELLPLLEAFSRTGGLPGGVVATQQDPPKVIRWSDVYRMCDWPDVYALREADIQAAARRKFFTFYEWEEFILNLDGRIVCNVADVQEG